MTITNEYASINTLWGTTFKEHYYTLNNNGGILTITKDGKKILTMNESTGKLIGKDEKGLVIIEWIPLSKIAERYEEAIALDNGGWELIYRSRQRSKDR